MKSPTTLSVVFTRPVIIVISLAVMFVIGLYIVRSSYDTQMYQRLCKTRIISSSNEIETFASIGELYETDKITTHHYEVLYEKYLRKYVGSNIHLLEIGLGCGMGYGPGASAQLWRHYLGPLANIYFLEFNRRCGEIWYESLGYKLNVTMFYGSQDDISVLNNVNFTRGNFDVIIDDGGHTAHQQITSFINLLPKVKSRGIYVIEDSASKTAGDSVGSLWNLTTIEFIKILNKDIQGISPQNSMEVAYRIHSFEIASEVCFFTVK